MIKDNLEALIRLLLDFLKVRLTNGELRFSLFRALGLMGTLCICTLCYRGYEEMVSMHTEIRANYAEFVAKVQTNASNIALLQSGQWDLQSRADRTERDVGYLQNDVRTLWNNRLKTPRQSVVSTTNNLSFLDWQ